MSAQHIPTGFQGLNGYAYFDDVNAAIALYKQAFHAQEKTWLAGPDGQVVHAELIIEGTVLMMGRAMPEWRCMSAQQLGGSPVSFLIYVPDVEASFARAQRAGLIEKKPIEDMFWGDRMGRLIDPFGYEWSVAQQVRQMSPEEMQHAFDKQLKAMEIAA